MNKRALYESIMKVVSKEVKMALNETRWEYDDKSFGMRPVKKDRPEDQINLMSQMPAKSGYVVLFQNRVNIQSVGNLRGKQVMWFDRQTRSLKEDEDSMESFDWRTYNLPYYGRPQGWMYEEDYRRLGYRN